MTGLQEIRRAALPGVVMVAALLTAAVRPSCAQDAGGQIRQEIQRLQSSVKDKPVSSQDFAGAGSSIDDDLKEASVSLDAGRLYASLENLEQALDLLEGMRCATDRKADIDRGGMQAYQSFWDAESAKLTAFEAEARRVEWKDLPAGVQALAETAATRARPLLDGGLGFAVATGPKDGLFYAGQAQGEASFARFCASLKRPPGGGRPALRSFLPELENLQEKTNAAFQPPKSIELHSRFIALNSTLKLAQELNSAKAYAGALFQYLEATRHYGMLDAAVLDAAGQSAVKKDLAAAHQRLAGQAADNSIVELFLERADTLINRPDGSTPGGDEWRSARVILDRVVPAYFEAMHAVAAAPRPAGKLIDITLVRWPYT